MNKKLKFAFKSSPGEQGFAIPIAVGLGLIMILIATTLVVRSQGDQVSASAQKSTAQSLSVTEAGVTRVQAFLNQNKGLANQRYPWTTYLANLATPCTSGTLHSEAEAFDNWIPVGSGDDRFKVISYEPNTTEGVLVVEGQARQGSNVKSPTRLQVKVPFDRSRIPSFEPPGAWAEKFVLGNNLITGNVIDTGCPPGSISTTGPNPETDQISGTVTNNPGLTLPPALPVPTVCTGSLVYPTTCAAMALPVITGNLTLPRTASPVDVANTNNEYVYYVAKDNVSSNKSINLNGTGKLIITPGKKVKLYLEGNVNTSGGGVAIGHNCYDTNADGEPDSATPVIGCEPTNFQIYGGIGTTEITFAGNNTVDAFIFAPNAINSGVNGTAQIRGSIWLKEWDKSSARQLVISQTGSWNNIPSSLWPPRIAPLGSWERQVVP